MPDRPLPASVPSVMTPWLARRQVERHKNRALMLRAEAHRKEARAAQHERWAKRWANWADLQEEIDAGEVRDGI